MDSPLAAAAADAAAAPITNPSLPAATSFVVERRGLEDETEPAPRPAVVDLEVADLPPVDRVGLLWEVRVRVEGLSLTLSPVDLGRPRFEFLDLAMVGNFSFKIQD